MNKEHLATDLQKLQIYGKFKLHTFYSCGAYTSFTQGY